MQHGLYLTLQGTRLTQLSQQPKYPARRKVRRDLQLAPAEP